MSPAPGEPGPAADTFLAAEPPARSVAVFGGAAYHVIGGVSVSHLLNDMMSSLLLAIYPVLRQSMALSFAQVGLITLTYQLTASFLQPLVGWIADRHPKPYSLALGMCFTISGLLILSQAGTFPMVLAAAVLVGMGSSIFHPESSRVARLASGGRFGLAQSLFQVGGNLGSALGPLLAALVVVPHGQASVAWFAGAAMVAALILLQVGHWYKAHLIQHSATPQATAQGPGRGVVLRTLGILLLLIFSKYFYLSSLSSYYTFYLMDRFQLSVKAAQVHLFAYLFAVAAGTVLGGPVGDRIGRKRVIWASILGAAPFTLALPHANLFWTGVLSVVIGLVIASAFSAILVFAQELVPGRVGMVSGLFFGFAFGVGGVGAALLGNLADATSIAFVYRLCAWLPLLGLLTVFLPDSGVPARNRPGTNR